MNKQLGIIITGGEGPKPQALRQLIDSLETEPLLVAADSGLHLAEAAGLTPHWIIGDMDSLDGECLNKYPSEKIIRHPADKDYTDTELALTLLREQGGENAWIIGGGGGRIDHLFGIRDLFERERFPRRWITAAEDIYCIEGGGLQGSDLTLVLDRDSLVSVLPLGAGPWKAESRGLKWPLDVVHWERGFYGLSNRTIMDKAEIHAIQGRFMVICNINSCFSV